MTVGHPSATAIERSTSPQRDFNVSFRWTSTSSPVLMRPARQSSRKCVDDFSGGLKTDIRREETGLDLIEKSIIDLSTGEQGPKTPTQ